jgi:hypothetical protein
LNQRSTRSLQRRLAIAGAVLSLVLPSTARTQIPSAPGDTLPKPIVSAPSASAGQAAPDTTRPGWWVPAGPLLPSHRIVAFYGNPLSRGMGILGELRPKEMMDRLQRQADAYQQADTATEVIPALELVATVANPDPGAHGLYRGRMRDEVMERVARWAESRHWLLILDVQPGRAKVVDEVRALLPWLRRPNVHLALDPEFTMPAGQVPGRQIGTMDAEDVNASIRLIAELVRKENLPPKLLIVHRFTRPMLTHAARIAPDSAVQVVIDMDGFGPPRLKHSSYAAWVAGQPVQFTGFKLFYRYDRPLMQPADVLRLKPVPHLVIYQ